MAYTRVVRAGTDIEVYEYGFRPTGPALDRKKVQRRKRGVGGGDEKRLLRRFDNVHRARRSFQRIVRANLGAAEHPALFTFTMFEILAIPHAYAAFNVFVRRLRSVAGQDFRYIAVPEFQRRGAVHFHALIWGLPDRYVKNERNDRLFQHLWQRGFVDCVPTDGDDKLIGYLAKYMSKAMHDQRLFGAKAYTSSRNALRPLLFKIDEEFDDVADYFLTVDKIPSQDREYLTQWLGKGRYRLFKNVV